MPENNDPAESCDCALYGRPAICSCGQCPPSEGQSTADALAKDYLIAGGIGPDGTCMVHFLNLDVTCESPFSLQGEIDMDIEQCRTDDGVLAIDPETVELLGRWRRTLEVCLDRIDSALAAPATERPRNEEGP